MRSVLIVPLYNGPSAFPITYGGFNSSRPGRPVLLPWLSRLSALAPGGWKSAGKPGNEGQVVRTGGGVGGSPELTTHWNGSGQRSGQKFAGYDGYCFLQ